MDDFVEIPNGVDDTLVLFWRPDQFIAGMVGLVIGGQLLGLLGAVGGAYLAFKVITKFSARMPKGFVRHALYWWGVMTIRKYCWGNGLCREVLGK